MSVTSSVRDDTIIAPPNGPVPASIEAAFQQTQSFTALRNGAGDLPPSEAHRLAEEEAAFGRVNVDPRGLTAGMRLHFLPGARAAFTAWRAARAPFDQLMAPHLSKIESIDHVEDEIRALNRKCEDEEAALERQLESDTKYQQIKDRHDHAESRFNEKFAENDQRVPVVWGYHWSYVAALAFTGVAEWFINYDVFLRFLQVPAWAAATAIILGALLAFAAHGHGTLIKQWAFRFGAARTRAQRFTDWRLLALSTLGLAVVLAAAGGSRYAAVIRLAGNAPPINLLGAEAEIDISPVRDVLISLLGNLGAWIVGVFWAYIGHDPDPEYMEAAHERQRARAPYNRSRANHDRDKESIRARYFREIAKKQTASQTIRRDFERLRNLLLQVREHEAAILLALQSAVRTSAQQYQEALIQLATQRPGKLSFFRSDTGETISPYDYKSMSIAVDTDAIRGAT